MSLPAFYLPETEWQSVCTLDGDEARHFLVLRIRMDEKIMLLDGKGRSAICRILEIGRRSIRVEMEREWFTPEPASRPIIAIALSKAVRRGFFLEKAAELGAWAVWLWQAQRSQGHIDAKLLASCLAQIRAGAKQCRNPWFPGLENAGDARTLAALAQKCDCRLLPWEEKAGEPVVRAVELGRQGTTIYVIGPEGGIAEIEAECFKEAGFKPVSLGERVLRCETAATLCLGLHCWASQLRKNGDETAIS